MQKKGFKNFICSFVLSLFAVVAVNRAVFHKPNSSPSSSIAFGVETPNISLFATPVLETNDNGAAKRTPAGTDLSALESLTAEPVAIKEIEPIAPQIKTAAGAKAPQQPALLGLTPDQLADKSTIQVARNEKAGFDPHSKFDLLTQLDNAQEIILEKEAEPLPSPQVTNAENSGIVYADISDTLKDEKAQTDEPEPKPDVLYTPQDIGGTSAKPEHGSNSKGLKKAPEILIAANETGRHPDNGMGGNAIPLIEDTNAAHQEIDVFSSADTSQVAMLEPNNLVTSIAETEESDDETLAEADLKQNEWKQMSDTAPSDPWIIAKGNKFAKNRSVVEHFAQVEEKNKTSENALNLAPSEKTAAETKVAYKMIQNLLIPIPEDIMNDADLTPQLSSTPSDKPQEKAQTAETEKKAAKKSAELKDSDKQSGLFKSIASWFSGAAKNDEKSSGKNSGTKKKSGRSGISFFGTSDDNEAGNISSGQIMPAELRLSFQPNRAEISGQTLRWIHAFADNARDNDDTYIEIRIDGTSSFALQQKRLNLLSTILANRGVDFRKINIVFTSREPNSFIIRNIRFNNNTEEIVNQNSNNAYYQPW